MAGLFDNEFGGIVLTVIAFYVAWWLFKNVFGSGSSSGSSRQLPYAYMGKRFKTE